MSIQVEDRQGVAVVHVEGDLKGDDGGDFARQTADLLTQGYTRIVIDMAGVGMISSAGLGDLVQLTARANSQHARVVLAAPTPFVLGVFDATKLSKFFEMHDQVDDAVKALTA